MNIWLLSFAAVTVPMFFGINKWLIRHYTKKYGYLFEEMIGLKYRDNKVSIKKRTIHILSALPIIQICYSAFLMISAKSSIQALEAQALRDKPVQSHVYECTGCHVMHRKYQQLDDMVCPYCKGTTLERRTDMDKRELDLAPLVKNAELLGIYIQRALDKQAELDAQQQEERRLFERETFIINQQQVLLLDELRRKQSKALDTELIVLSQAHKSK